MVILVEGGGGSMGDDSWSHSVKQVRNSSPAVRTCVEMRRSSVASLAYSRSESSSREEKLNLEATAAKLRPHRCLQGVRKPEWDLRAHRCSSLYAVLFHGMQMELARLW